MNTKLLVVIISLLICGCSRSKDLSKSNIGKKIPSKNEIVLEETQDQTSEMKMSAHTKIFIQKLNNAINKSELFLPSEKFINEYNLQKIEDEYHIGGMLKVQENINEKEISDLGVKIGTKAGNIWTVRIPILQMEKIIILSGIEYIQIDEPLKLR